jgi:hypothetical protein
MQIRMVGAARRAADSRRAPKLSWISSLAKEGAGSEPELYLRADEVDSLAWSRVYDVAARMKLRDGRGGELDQIQFLLGHVSIQTTEHYLGCKQKLRIAVNDRLGIEPDTA